jgi:2-octaprenyl-6-methoxyphenol hydroxylase
MKNQINADIVIAGGGLVGMTLSLALARGGLNIVVIDALDPQTVTAASFDGRVSAVAFASRRMLSALGLDPYLKDRTQPIDDILVSDGSVRAGAAPLTLHFDHREIGDAPLGELIENRHTRMALFAAAAGLDNLRLLAPARVESLSLERGRAILAVSGGRTISAAVCIAADGRDSPLRKQMGIRNASWSYGQTGIVATIAHERPHNGIAHELFLPSGPFAILPMTGNRSSIVWTENSAAAPAFLRLPGPDFVTEAQKRFGDHWGKISIEGPRWSYPLSLHLASRYVGDRFALAGDAAHGIHPIAGQGFNLGLRDAAAIAEVMIEAARLGQDLGSPAVLERYQRWRTFDNLALAASTDLLTRLFSNDLRPLRVARSLGLAIVNEIGPLRRLFMRHAGGAVGELPRLLRGEAI